MLKAVAIIICMMTQQSHVSMTGLELVEGTDSLKVSCRMYFNDFLNDLHTIDDDRNLDRLFKKQPFPEDLINHYFNAKVFIYINDELLIGKLISYNLTDNDFIMNLVYKTGRNPKKITVKNTILTTWFSDQENLIIIRSKNTEKGIKLTPQNNELSMVLK